MTERATVVKEAGLSSGWHVIIKTCLPFNGIFTGFFFFPQPYTDLDRLKNI